MARPLNLDFRATLGERIRNGVKEYFPDYDDPQTGKRIRKPSFTSKKEARAELKDIITRIKLGRHVTPSKMLFGYVADEWLKSRDQMWKQRRIAWGSLKSDRTSISCYIKPAFAHVKMADLYHDWPRMQKAVDDNLGKGLAQATVRRGVVVTLGLIWEHARDHNWVPSNPLKDRPLNCPIDKTERPIPTDAELQRVLDVLEQPRIGKKLFLSRHLNMVLSIKLSMMTGMRPGEIGGLAWEAIEWPEGDGLGLIHVRQRMTLKDGLRPGTKTGVNKVRAHPLTPELHDALIKYSLGTGRPMEGLIFHTQGGKGGNGHGDTGRSSGALATYWNEVARRAGLVDADGNVKYELYALRHAYATRHVNAQHPLTEVAYKLGHSPEMLVGRYAHVRAADPQLHERTRALSSRFTIAGNAEEVLTPGLARRLFQEGLRVAEIAQRYGADHATVLHWVKDLQKERTEERKRNLSPEERQSLARKAEAATLVYQRKRGELPATETRICPAPGCGSEFTVDLIRKGPKYTYCPDCRRDPEKTRRYWDHKSGKARRDPSGMGSGNFLATEPVDDTDQSPL